MASEPQENPSTGAGPGLVDRAKNIILQPKTEWPVIENESTSTSALMTGWVLPLAAIGPVAGLIGGLVFGYGTLGFHYRPSLSAAVTGAVVSYILSIVGIWVLSLIINALAPHFGGTSDSRQAMKVAVYSATAGWLAGIFQILPAIGFLGLGLGLLGLYSLYLLYLGLPMLMKAPDDKAVSYTIVTVIVAAVLFIVMGAITGAVTSRFISSPLEIGSNDTVDGTISVPGVGSIDLGKVEQASKQLGASADAATESGGQASGAVKAVEPDALQGLLPAGFTGWTRTEVESTGGAIAGVGGSNASARYETGDNHFTLSITDMGAAGSLASAFNLKTNKQTATGYERTETVDGHMVSEKWDTSSHRGSYATMVGGRFMVQAEGNAPGIDTLKGAVGAVDAGQLAQLAK